MFTDGAEGAELVLLSPAAAPPGLRLFLGSRFVAEVPDSPASTNSATTTASSDAALRVLASRCAGIEKPSSRPPRVAWSTVETRKIGDGGLRQRRVGGRVGVAGRDSCILSH